MKEMRLFDQPPRDPARIEKVLAILRNAWYAYPDLRLGQLLTNVCPPHKDLYYLEEEDLIKALIHYMPAMEKT
jgi:uncharacterized protein YihD (DUF1040 family)